MSVQEIETALIHLSQDEREQIRARLNALFQQANRAQETRQLKQPRPYALAAGEFVVPDDFDAPLPEEILRDFEGV